MVIVFAETTTHLSSEFISCFNDEDLICMLSQLCKTNVEVDCNKGTSSSFKISGQWKDLLLAHSYLHGYLVNINLINKPTKKTVADVSSNDDHLNNKQIKDNNPGKVHESNTSDCVSGSVKQESDAVTCDQNNFAPVKSQVDSSAESLDSHIALKKEETCVIDEDMESQGKPEDDLECELDEPTENLGNKLENHLESAEEEPCEIDYDYETESTSKLENSLEPADEKSPAGCRSGEKQSTEEGKKTLQHSENDQAEEYKCKKCKYVGKNLKRIREHISRIHSPRYSCEMCDKKFGYQKDLRYHVNHMHLSTTYDCKICDKSFKHKASHYLHMKTHDNSYVPVKLECSICHRTFRNNYQLKAHKKKEHIDKNAFICEICGEGFSRKILLYNHETSVHLNGVFNGGNEKNEQNCPVALNLSAIKSKNDNLNSVTEENTNLNSIADDNLNLNSMTDNLNLNSIKTDNLNLNSITGDNIEMNEDTYTDEQFVESVQVKSLTENQTGQDGQLSEDYIKTEQKYSVNDAGVRKQNKKNTKKVKINKNDSNQELKCDKCNYVGKSIKNFKEHMSRIHTLRYACELCDRKFGYQKDLRYHITHLHQVTTYFCEICNKTFKHQSSHYSHMKTHDESYVRSECDLCHKTFMNKYLLKQHVKNEHSGKKVSYPCDTCDRSFPTKDSLFLHQISAHGRRKECVCEVCGKSFPDNRNLKVHKHLHDVTPQFKCDVCGKSFRQRGSFVKHVKIHSDRRDYACPTCGKEFTQQGSLKRHERIHTGEKPYKCALCKSEFNDYSIIRRHMILVHKRDKDPKYWMGDVIHISKKDLDISDRSNKCYQKEFACDGYPYNK